MGTDGTTLYVPRLRPKSNRGHVTVRENDEVTWAGVARVAALPEGALVLIPTSLPLAPGEEVRVDVRTMTRAVTLPDDIGAALGLAPGATVDPAVAHLVRWVDEATGVVRAKRIAWLAGDDSTADR